MLILFPPLVYRLLDSLCGFENELCKLVIFICPCDCGCGYEVEPREQFLPVCIVYAKATNECKVNAHKVDTGEKCASVERLD